MMMLHKNKEVANFNYMEHEYTHLVKYTENWDIISQSLVKHIHDGTLYYMNKNLLHVLLNFLYNKTPSNEYIPNLTISELIGALKPKICAPDQYESIKFYMDNKDKISELASKLQSHFYEYKTSNSFNIVDIKQDVNKLIYDICVSNPEYETWYSDKLNIKYINSYIYVYIFIYMDLSGCRSSIYRKKLKSGIDLRSIIYNMNYIIERHFDIFKILYMCSPYTIFTAEHVPGVLCASILEKDQCNYISSSVYIGRIYTLTHLYNYIIPGSIYTNLCELEYTLSTRTHGYLNINTINTLVSLLIPTLRVESGAYNLQITIVSCLRFLILSSYKNYSAAQRVVCTSREEHRDRDIDIVYQKFFKYFSPIYAKGDIKLSSGGHSDILKETPDFNDYTKYYIQYLEDITCSGIDIVSFNTCLYYFLCKQLLYEKLRSTDMTNIILSDFKSITHATDIYSKESYFTDSSMYSILYTIISIITKWENNYQNSYISKITHARGICFNTSLNNITYNIIKMHINNESISLFTASNALIIKDGNINYATKAMGNIKKNNKKKY